MAGIIQDIIHHPVYLIFLLVLLLVVVSIIWMVVGSGTDIGQSIFGFFNTLFK